PRNRATLEQGETIEYRLTAINEHQREVTGASATLDLSDVLASADLSTPLPGDVTREGSTLTWAPAKIPARDCFLFLCDDGRTSVTISVTVKEDLSESVTFSATAVAQDSGSCSGSCSVAHTVDVPDPASITVHAGGVRTGTTTVDPLPDGAVMQ